ncbi:MAG: hypothetical protein ACK4N1_12750 [Pseudorhizobium sp.]
MADKIWFIVVALGPVLLGCVIAYAMMRRRRLTAPEKFQQEKAVERLYDKPDGGRDSTPNRS